MLSAHVVRHIIACIQYNEYIHHQKCITNIGSTIQCINTRNTRHPNLHVALSTMRNHTTRSCYYNEYVHTNRINMQLLTNYTQNTLSGNNVITITLCVSVTYRYTSALFSIPNRKTKTKHSDISNYRSDVVFVIWPYRAL